MENAILRKGLVIGIILLFVGTDATTGILKKNNVINIFDDQIDQQQPLNTSGFSITFPYMAAQSFKPNLSTLTRVKLGLSRDLQASGNLVISIRQTINGSDLTSTSITVQSMPPYDVYMVEFNFPEISVQPEQTYYIVLADTSNDYQNCVYWVCFGCVVGEYDNYHRGSPWSYNPNGGWTKDCPDDNGYDFCFRTYGENKSDLTVTPQDISIPNYMVENQQYTITAHVRNIGSASAQNFNVQFLAWTPTANDWTILATYPWYQLDPGTSITMQTSFYPQESGTYLIKVIADVNNNVDESNESNNEAITGGFVRPVTSIYPSLQYHSGPNTLDIDARFYNNIIKQYMTSGIATWKIYDQTGTLCLQGSLAYQPTAGLWQAHNIDVSSLTTGGLYTVRVIWGYNAPYEELNFRKTSGYSFIEGHVKDERTGAPIANAELYIFDPWWDIFFWLPKISTTTNSTGYYSFLLAVDPTWPMFMVATATNYQAQPRSLYPVSDQTYEINCQLTKTSDVHFQTLLVPLNESIHTTINGTVDKVVSINNDVQGILHPDQGEQWCWTVLDLTGGIMVGSADSFTELPLSFSSQAFEATLDTTVKEGIKDTLKDFVIEKAGIYGLQQFIDANKDLTFTTNWVEQQNAYIGPTTDVTAEHRAFQTAAQGKVVPDSFSLTDADSAVLAITDQLDTLFSRDSIIIPYNMSHPIVLLFPNGYQAFTGAQNHYEQVEGAGEILTVAQLFAGVAAVALICTGAGAPAGVAILVGEGVGYAGTGVDVYDEIQAKPACYFAAGQAIGRWCRDLCAYVKIMGDAKDFFLSEVDNPYYMNKTNVFNAGLSITNFPNPPIVYAPWNGAILQNLFGVTITNTGNVMAKKIFLNIDGLWMNFTNVPKNGQVTLPGVDYMIKPYGPWDLFSPHHLTVEAYSGSSISPKASQTIDYFISPQMDKSSGSLPISTSNKRLKMSDYKQFLPTNSTILDGDLTTSTPLLETNYTVGNASRSVDFEFSYPQSTRMDLSVFDDQGRRIGYNYSTGCNDVQFIGTYTSVDTNPQVISISSSAGKTYHIEVRSAMMYSANESHHVVVKAFETPYRPAMLSVGSNEIVLSAAPGSNISIPVMLGEAGLSDPLFNVSVGISNITHDQINLSLLTDPTINVGVILPGTGTYETFTFTVPSNAPEGEYTGVITVNASNAVPIPVNVRILVSKPPEQPVTPSGPSCGVVEKNYTYTTNTVDPEGDQVYYQWNWGDGGISDWIGPFNSGATVTMSHLWQNEGEYHITVLAKDSYGIVSSISQPFFVDIINASLLKKTWLIGAITNLNTGTDLTCFNASLLFSIRFGPFSFTPYFSGEKLVVSNQYLGKIGTHFIIGRFDAMVLSGSTLSRVYSLRERLKQLLATQTMK